MTRICTAHRFSSASELPLRPSDEMGDSAGDNPGGTLAVEDDEDEDESAFALSVNTVGTDGISLSLTALSAEDSEPPWPDAERSRARP